MNTKNRKRIVIACIVMIIIVVTVSYFLDHILLQMPLWFVFILISLSLIASTIGTLLALGIGRKKK